MRPLYCFFRRRILLLFVSNFIFLFISVTGNSQTPYLSESIIKYDLNTHKTDKPIPFDRAFTLVIEKLSSKEIDVIHAYEIEEEDGSRNLKKNELILNGSKVKASIMDVDLPFKKETDTLYIYFPPLKPNKDFDINIISFLPKDSRTSLFKINTLLAQGKINEATQAYAILRKALENSFNNRTYLKLYFNGYHAFFNSNLSAIYNLLRDDNNFSVSNRLTYNHIRAIDIGSSRLISDFKDAYLINELFRKGLVAEMQRGLVDINKIYQTDFLTDRERAEIRVSNLEAGLKFLDSVQQRAARLISRGVTSQSVEGTDVAITDAQLAISEVRTNMQSNLKNLKDQLKLINKEIDGNENIRSGTYLAGNTLATDLKTKGGNILFLDAGFTNIVASNIHNTATYIPKLYWGVSIYFRPIDKNTRRSKFPDEFNPSKRNGCDTAGNCGPDYGIVSKKDLLQHLSLNIGITLGSMQNSEFENLYNNNSLLIGPAYRIARGFKLSAGMALLKRSSIHPLESNKKVQPGGYFSLSTDIDIIQGIKDVTSILFK